MTRKYTNCCRRTSPALCFNRTEEKLKTRGSIDGFSIRSFRTLMNDIAKLTLNEVCLNKNSTIKMTVLAETTELQRRAFELMVTKPTKFDPSASPV